MNTRDISSEQEKRVAKKLNGVVVPNSGAGKFDKSDVVIKDASMIVECKTCASEKKSFSIKKEWLEKNRINSFSNRMDNSSLAFSFCYDSKDDFYIIDDKLMKFLIEKLKEEYKIV